MDFYKKIIAVTSLISISLTVNADEKIDQALATVYKQFDTKHGCWLFDAQQYGIYCMKIDQYTHLKADSGKDLTYVLLAGTALSKNGKLGAPDVYAGRAAALIFENEEKTLKLTASNLDIPCGGYGAAPTGWKLKKLGPDYWGWQNISNFTAQSRTNTRHLILAPYGNTVKKIASFVTAASYSRPTEHGKNATALKSNLSFDTKKIIDGFYRLNAKVSGKKEGRKIATKTWKIAFDKTTWSYKQPINWPIESY